MKVYAGVFDALIKSGYQVTVASVTEDGEDFVSVTWNAADGEQHGCQIADDDVAFEVALRMGSDLVVALGDYHADTGNGPLPREG